MVVLSNSIRFISDFIQEDAKAKATKTGGGRLQLIEAHPLTSFQPGNKALPCVIMCLAGT